VIIHDFDTHRFVPQPLEAYSVLVVDTNAVLTLPVSVKCFQSVPGRRVQIAQIIGIIQIDQFASSGFLDAQRQFSRNNPLKYFSRFGVREGFDHAFILSCDDNIVKRSRISGAVELDPGCAVQQLFSGAPIHGIPRE
jgi:hypothetical protein